MYIHVFYGLSRPFFRKLFSNYECISYFNTKMIVLINYLAAELTRYGIHLFSLLEAELRGIEPIEIKVGCTGKNP